MHNIQINTERLLIMYLFIGSFFIGGLVKHYVS